MDIAEGIAGVMEDHFVICRARNYLADALKVLLKAEIMNADDFSRSREAALSAVEELNDLLRQPHRDASKS